VKQPTGVGALIKAGFGVLVIASFAAPSAHAAVAGSHVISNTGISMIDTVYDAQGHVHQINTFPNTPPTPYIYFTRTAYTPPANANSAGGYQLDSSSVPESIEVQDAAGNPAVQDNSAVGQIQMPPNAPVPGYSGPVFQGYTTYDPTSGMPSGVVYVVFMYSNGNIIGVSTMAAPPPAAGGGHSGCGGDAQRPCPQPDSASR
jgi:hypothetical protein